MSCQTCNYGDKIFTFRQNESKTFKQLQVLNNCTLATDLDKGAFERILQCCKTQGSYWIGLKADANCRSSTSYRWIGSGQCVASGLLNLQPPTFNNNQCTAVQIETRKGDGGKVINSQTFVCTKKAKYICEKITSTTRISPTPSTTTTRRTKKTPSTTTRTSTESATIQSKNTTIPTINIASSTTTTSPIPLSSPTPPPSSSNIGAIIGVVVPCVLLVLLLALLYRQHRRRKHSESNHFKCLPLKISSLFSRRKPASHPRNYADGQELYYTVEQSSQNHYNSIANSTDTPNQIEEAYATCPPPSQIAPGGKETTSEYHELFVDGKEATYQNLPNENYDSLNHNQITKAKAVSLAEKRDNQKSQPHTPPAEPAVYATVVKDRNLPQDNTYAAVKKPNRKR